MISYRSPAPPGIHRRRHPSAALATIKPAFTGAGRLALAGFLAGYRGLTPRGLLSLSLERLDADPSHRATRTTL